MLVWLLPLLAMASTAGARTELTPAGVLLHDLPADTVDLMFEEIYSNVGDPFIYRAFYSNAIGGLFRIRNKPPIFFRNVSAMGNNTWLVGYCTQLTDVDIRDCALEAVAYNVFSVLANGSTVPTDIRDTFLIPPNGTQEIEHVSVSRVELNVSWKVIDTSFHQRVVVYPGRRQIPNLPDFVVTTLNDEDEQDAIVSAETSSLIITVKPSHFVLVRVVQRGVSIIETFAVIRTAQALQLLAPTYQGIIFINPNAIAFLVNIPEWSEVVDSITIRATDTFTNITSDLERPFSGGTFIVPQILADGNMFLRLFITGGFPNTLYRWQVAANTRNNTARTVFSDMREARTSRDIQAPPGAVVPVDLNSTHVLLPGPRVTREFGITSRSIVRLSRRILVNGRINDTVARVITCPGLCTAGVRVDMTEFSATDIVVAVWAIVNDVGTSAFGDAVQLIRPASRTTPQDNVAVITLSVTIPMVVVVLLVGAVVYRRQRILLSWPIPVNDSYEIPRKNITLRQNRLGQGATSVVYEGLLQRTRDTRPLVVAVKVIQLARLTVDGLSCVANEVQALIELNHPYIVHLYAVVTQSNPLMFVFELCHRGDLCNVLRTGKETILTHQLTQWSAQSASALAYVHSRGILHRDVAARNMLVTVANDLRLADLGMSRPTVKDATYELIRNTAWPVRWTSPDTLRRGLTNVHTDTWSLSVLLYEIFSHGDVPYSHIPDLSIVAQEVMWNALRPGVPYGTPSSIAQMMNEIWYSPQVARTITALDVLDVCQQLCQPRVFDHRTVPLASFAAASTDVPNSAATAASVEPLAAPTTSTASTSFAASVEPSAASTASAASTTAMQPAAATGRRSPRSNATRITTFL